MRDIEQPDPARIDGPPYPTDWLEIKMVWLDILLLGNVSKEAFMMATESIDYSRMTGWHITQSEMDLYFQQYPALLNAMGELLDSGLCRWFSGKQGLTYIFFAGEETWPFKVEEPAQPS